MSDCPTDPCRVVCDEGVFRVYARAVPGGEWVHVLTSVSRRTASVYATHLTDDHEARRGEIAAARAWKASRASMRVVKS